MIVSRRFAASLAAFALLATASCALPKDRPGGARAPQPAASTPASHTAPPTPTLTPTASTTPTPTASATALPPPVVPPRTFDPKTSVTVTVSGDLLWHMSLVKAAAADARARHTGHAYEFGPMLEPVKPIIEGADLSICHQEVPVAPTAKQIAGYPAFGSPADAVRAAKETGFDACTTSSNHSMDKGWNGIVATLDAMQANGIVATGTFRTADERATPAVVTTASGVMVALVSGTYGLNGYTLPSGRPYAVAMLDAADMIARARAARAAGADIVLAAMHAGTEYQMMPDALQKKTVQTLTASGAFDLVYGHHAHVVQPITQVNGVWVIYGVSNLIGQMRLNTPAAWDGIIGKVTFVAKPEGGFTVGQVEYIPLRVTDASKGPPRVLPVNESLRNGTGDRGVLEASLARTRKGVHALKAPGLVEG